MPKRSLWTLEQAKVEWPTSTGSSPVLRRLDLSIEEGEFVAVVGRNGSGKSTLLRVLAGLTALTGGRMEAVREDRPSASLVFQNPDAQLVGETVLEEIGFGLELNGVPPEEMPGRVQRALKAVGLEPLKDEPVERLSGGQKQLLAIASALALETKALLLDEPTAMLDASSGTAVLETAKRLQRRGTTIVWATQSMGEVGAADRVIALADGKVAFDGSPARFFYGERGASGTAVDQAGDGERTIGENAAVPCLALGMRLPYAVETAHHLLRMGVELAVLPVTDAELMEAGTEACR